MSVDKIDSMKNFSQVFSQFLNYERNVMKSYHFFPIFVYFRDSCPQFFPPYLITIQVLDII